MPLGILILAFLVLILRKKNIFIAAGWIAAFFFFSGLLTPGLLKPVFIFWVKLGSLLGWVNSRIILIAMFYLIFSPFGLIMRLFKKDLLDMKIDKKKESYWIKSEEKEFDRLNYERQF